MASSASSRWSYRPGARYSVAPEVVAAEIERVRSVSGAVTAERLVDESRAPDAPLHPVFEWDDGAAAELYRRDQARALIRSVQVTYSGEAPMSAFVHVPAQDGNTGDYQPILVVAQHQDRFDAALSEAQRFLLAAERSVAELHAVAWRVRAKAAPRVARAAKAIARAKQDLATA